MEKESHFQNMEEQLRQTREQADRDKQALEEALMAVHVKEEVDDNEEGGGEWEGRTYWLLTNEN